ncbi:MAG TPA: hypothetical protein VGO29_12760 [Solirubrobacteraceae bacterium]|jgi:hypothetical protein|nr:hypothetical protein [Solirubrobacteraceae bacterium]
MAETPASIDWENAEVKEGTATVPLSGDASKAWNQRFEGVAALLARNDGGWSEIALKKQTIAITQLRPGSEDDLRHFLESVVVQVNSELAPDPEQQTSEPDDPQAAQDEQMAERLRSFSARRD